MRTHSQGRLAGALLTAAMALASAPAVAFDDEPMGLTSEDVPEGVLPVPPPIDGATPTAADAALIAEIEGRLDRELSDGPGIEVEAVDGVVTLSGWVESEANRELAEEIAGGVDGVRGVRNEISIHSEPPLG